MMPLIQSCIAAVSIYMAYVPLDYQVLEDRDGATWSIFYYLLFPV